VRLLIYGLNYRPELVGVGKYTAEMAEWLVLRGHEVTVVTAPPHYPEWRIGPGYQGNRYSTEDVAGVRVVRCPIWLPREYSPLKRILSVMAFAFMSFASVLREAGRRPDCLIVIEPSFFCLPGAWIASRLMRIPLWLHVQDFELGAASKLGLVRGHALLRLAAAVERWFLRRPDRVSTLSEPMLRQLARAGVPENRRVLFPNWVDCAEFRPSPQESPFREELGILPGQIVLLYSGSFGRKHGLEVLTQAARLLLPHPEFQFVLCGEGSERKRLRLHAADLPNIRWLPLQPRERLNDLLNSADIHLLPQRASVTSDVLPSKLTGMLASGRPIIATVGENTAIGDVVSDCGVAVPPEDPAALANAVLRLGRDAALRGRLGLAARAYAEMHTNLDQILGRFEAQLLRLSSVGRRN
jgi:colanic acid biosynthesis glycosyl transferase WcaI